MVHIPSTYTYDFWLRSSTDLSVELSCLMPNGVFIPLEVKKNATLQEIKEVSKLFRYFPNQVKYDPRTTHC